MLPGANLKFVSYDFNVYSLFKSVEKVSYHEFPKSQFFTFLVLEISIESSIVQPSVVENPCVLERNPTIEIGVNNIKF